MAYVESARRMRATGIGLIVASAILSSSAAANTDTFFRLALYNDTIHDWNSRTEAAYDANATYTYERGSCMGEDIVYEGQSQDTKNIDLRGVNPGREVFEDGCGVEYAAEPTFYDGDHNRTWVAGHTLTIFAGAGCTTRTVNGTWDNFCPSMPGGGYHKEYLMPVEDETVVSVNGAVCFNETIIRGEGTYPGEVDSVRMLEVNCSINGSYARVSLTHTCRGFVLLDSAYLVMGWAERCDRYRFMKNCQDGCAAANSPGSNSKGGAGGSGGMCDSGCCLAACTNMADRECVEEKSGRAECDAKPSGRYGMPEDGTSTYFMEKPPDINNPCYCRYVWDGSNACMNNRVSVAAHRAYVCSDEKRYVIDVEPNISVNGSISFEGSYVKGFVDVDSDTATAFLIGDVPYRFETFAPRHTLYRISDAAGEPIREYRLPSGDYAVNGSHDDSGYFDFTYPETVPDRTPPAAGESLTVTGFSGGNGSWRLKFVSFGSSLPDNLTLTILGVEDRVNRLRGPCDFENPCGRGLYCMDGYCLNLSSGRSFRLKDILREASPTTLALSGPDHANPRENVTVYAKLLSDDVPLPGRNVTLACGYLPPYVAQTDAEGAASFTVSVGETTNCQAGYEGEFKYAPCGAIKSITVKADAADWDILLLIASPICLVAACLWAAGGRLSLLEYFSTLRGFLK